MSTESSLSLFSINNKLKSKQCCMFDALNSSEVQNAEYSICCICPYTLISFLQVYSIIGICKPVSVNMCCAQ